MKRMLYIRNVNASWAIRDREILKQNFILDDFYLKPSGYLNPSWILRVLRSDTLFFWFASLNFLPALILGKILGKKIVTVSGGFDAAAAYSINYGAFTHSKWSQRLRRFFFKSSDKILCVSKANMAETIINSGCSAKKCEMIYHGFEPLADGTRLVPWSERKDRVVMVAQCTNDTYYRKSVDDFLKLAQMNPEMDFVLVGEVGEDLQVFFDKTASSNFSYTGFLLFNGPDFKKLLNESKFIIQLSFYESFGCAVIDGAVMGCYPMASSNFSLFEVVHGLGSTFDHGNLHQISNIFKEKINSTVSELDCSRLSLEKFPLSKREEGLLLALKGLN